MGDADGRDQALRFERAEYAPGEGPGGTPSCGFCKDAITSVYFQIDDTVACPRCRTATLQQREAGSGFGRFARAIVYGSLAGAAGAAIWYGVRAATGYEVGLIALGVGLMVGGAVRAGSARRGRVAVPGPRDRAHLSVDREHLRADDHQGHHAARDPGGDDQPPAASPATSTEAAAAVPASAPAAAEPRKPLSGGQFALALGVFAALVLAIAMAVPFLGGLQNIIGLVVIGIALYEAWKLNRRVPLVITGPHRVGKPLDAPAGG